MRTSAGWNTNPDERKKNVGIGMGSRSIKRGVDGLRRFAVQPEEYENAQTSSTEDTSYYTDDEIRSGLRSLSESELKRIQTAAQYFSRTSGISADDLMQSAYVRLLKNSCKTHYELVTVITYIIKSIADGKESIKRQNGRIHTLDHEDIEKNIVANWHLSETNAEYILIRKNQKDVVMRKITALIGDDVLVRKLFEGRCDGLRGDELRRFVGISEKSMESVEKRLERRLKRLKDSSYE